MAETTAPTLLSATRIAPEVARLAWENHASTGATYSTIRVERRRKDGGVWGAIANLTGSQIQAKVYNAAAPGGLIEYEYRLIAIGPAGTSSPSSSQSVGVWVTAAPTLTAAIRTGATTAEISFTSPPGMDALVFRRRAG